MKMGLNLMILVGNLCHRLRTYICMCLQIAAVKYPSWLLASVLLELFAVGIHIIQFSHRKLLSIDL